MLHNHYMQYNKLIKWYLINLKLFTSFSFSMKSQVSQELKIYFIIHFLQIICCQITESIFWLWPLLQHTSITFSVIYKKTAFDAPKINMNFLPDSNVLTRKLNRNFQHRQQMIIALECSIKAAYAINKHNRLGATPINYNIITSQ